MYIYIYIYIYTYIYIYIYVHTHIKDTMDKDLGEVVADEEAAIKAFKDLMAAKTKEIIQ